MGYIVPINQYQYMQYQNREIGVGNDPIQSFPIQRVRPLDEQSKEYDHESFNSEPKEYQFEGYQQNYKKNVDQRIIAKVYGEITGKGNYFNDYI